MHGNLTVESVFVDRQGDWKLCGFEHITEYQQLVGTSLAALGSCLFVDGSTSAQLMQSIKRSMVPVQFLPPELAEAQQNLKTILPHSIGFILFVRTSLMVRFLDGRLSYLFYIQRIHVYGTTAVEKN